MDILAVRVEVVLASNVVTFVGVTSIAGTLHNLYNYLYNYFIFHNNLG